MGKINSDIHDFYLNYGREKKNLVTTRTIASLWWGLLYYKKNFEDVLKLEEIILDYAKKEWDDSTTCEFDQENKKIIVRSFLKNKKKEIQFINEGMPILC